MKRSLRRVVAGLALLVAVVVPAQAMAANACGYTEKQVFKPWNDLAYYYMVPGGNFDTTTAWTRSGDAAVVSSVSPLGGSKSLRLRKGGSALTPLFCVTADSPTMRLMLKDPGSSTAVIRVESLWTSATGSKVIVKIGEFGGSTAGWRLSPIMLVWANLVALFDSSGTWKMQLRFTSVSGEWLIDDVYVDPFRRK